MGIVGLGLARATSWAAAQVPVIEWNAHIFSPEVSKCPIHPKATYAPDMSVHPTDPLGAYLKRLDEEKINRAKFNSVHQPRKLANSTMFISVSCGTSTLRIGVIVVAGVARLQ